MSGLPANVRRDMGCMLGIVSAGLLAYANHLFNPFQFDSVRFLVENLRFADPAQLLSWNYYLTQYPWRGGLFWTFGLNAWLHGMRPFGFHLVNLAFHLMNALLIFLVTRQACRYFRPRTEPLGERGIALATALLFLLHPLQTESVIYIMSRSELMAGWCYLMTFYLFQRAVDPAGGASRRFKYVVVPLAVVLALAVGYSIKPTIATLPAALAMYYLLAPEGRAPMLARLLRWQWGIAAGALVAFAALGYQLATDPLFLAGSAAAAETVGRQTYLLTQPGVIVFYYFKLLLFPFNLNIDPEIPRAEHLSSLYFLGGAAVLALGLWLAARARHGRLYLFGLLWFLLVLTPSSSIVTLLDLAAEHRVYLASWGVMLLMVVGVTRLAQGLRRPGGSRAAVAAVLILMLVAFGALTARRNTVWANELLLWQDTHNKSPHKLRPLVNLGRAYTLAGDNQRAIAYYERSLENNRHFFQTHYNLAVLYLEQGRDQAALEHFKIAAALEPRVPDVHARLGDLYTKLGEWDRAVAHFKLAVELNPQYAVGFRNLGILHYQHLNNRRAAMHFFARSLFLAPNQPDADLLRRLVAGEPPPDPAHSQGPALSGK